MNNKKILFIRNDHIGDLFFSTQIFREFKKAWPDCNITLVCSKSTKELIEYNPYVDKVLELEMAEYSFKRVWEYFKMGLKIRKMKFDIGVDVRGSPLNACMLLWLGNIKTRVGKIDSSPNKLRQKIISMFLNSPIFTNHHQSTVHLAEENTNVINDGLGIYTKYYGPEIFKTTADSSKVKEFIKNNKIKKYICVMPIANGEYKQWSYNKWHEIIKYLARDYKVLLLGSFKEFKILNNLASGIENTSVQTGFNLREVSILFETSSLNIGSDSGVLHIAAASGSPSVVLSPSSPAIFKNGKFLPLGNSKVVWARGKDMNTIKVDEVKKAIKEILE